MLTINDYNHLKLLYDKFLKINQHIKELALKQDWESVNVAIQQKDSLLRQIILFEKPRIDLIKKNEELHKIRLSLIDLEKENILIVKKMRTELFEELKSVKKTKKILNAYEPTTNHQVSTFEITQED